LKNDLGETIGLMLPTQSRRRRREVEMPVSVFDTKAELAEAAAVILIQDLARAIGDFGSGSWVLAGGTTPEAAYRVIASRYLGDVDWDKVSFVMGDERLVPLENPDSNWGQAARILLHRIRSGTKLVPQTQLPLEASATQYETALRSLAVNSANVPRLDQVWLGMGEDGHTLSLFPGRPSLDEETRLVLPVADSPKPPPERITLSLMALRGARHCVIMAAGQGKAGMLKRAFDGDRSVPVGLAASTVEEAGGVVSWLLDSDAASLL